MPNKRNNRTQKQRLYCPHCQQPLWRLGSEKYFLFYQDALELKKNVGISRKNASLLLAQKNTYLDRNSWLEEFFCERHNKMWMRLTKQANGNIVAVPTTRSDWNYTTHTINPDLPNPSVSEFTHRMSRGGSVNVS